MENAAGYIRGRPSVCCEYTENVKIDVNNTSGEQVQTFEHPFDNRTFSKSKVLERYTETDYMSQLGDGVALKMIREANNLPEEWPALETMFFDDENRLWISTIVEDNDVYEWWILKKTGEVITKFEWQCDHPIEDVRNGKLYARETDEETGLQQIIRYRIDMN